MNLINKVNSRFIKWFKLSLTLLVTNRFVINILTFVFQHINKNHQLRGVEVEKLNWLGFLIQNKALSFSQLSQDLWVLFRCNSKENGFFVEVGSCHPSSLNNTFLLEENFLWQGLLIEPNPAMALLLRSARSSKVLEFAIAEGESIELFVSKNPEFSATKKQLEQNIHKLYSYAGKKVTVRATTLTDLLANNQCPPEFDFLSLDIEGGEVYALQTLDLNQFRPRLISVEHNFTNSRKIIHEYLLKNGYILDPLSLKNSWDDWYIDREYYEKECGLSNSNFN